MESDINEERAAQYCEKLLELGVDIVEALLELTDVELKEEIGIKMLGDRAKIRKLKGFSFIHSFFLFFFFSFFSFFLFFFFSFFLFFFFSFFLFFFFSFFLFFFFSFFSFFLFFFFSFFLSAWVRGIVGP